VESLTQFWILLARGWILPSHSYMESGGSSGGHTLKSAGIIDLIASDTDSDFRQAAGSQLGLVALFSEKIPWKKQFGFWFRLAIF
jgi:hypothetical protein